MGAQDPAEHHDLAKEQPDLMANITARWQAAQARAPYFQTNVRAPLAIFWSVSRSLTWAFAMQDTPGYTNCSTVKEFATVRARKNVPSLRLTSLAKG